MTAADRLSFAIDLAHRAGELGMRFFRELDSLTIESKGHQDLVSNADREVELFVRAEIVDDRAPARVLGKHFFSALDPASQMIFSLLAEISVVVKTPMSSTTPTLSTIFTLSPSSKGRKKSSITPLAKFERLPCMARPTARPAEARMATRLVVCRPTDSMDVITVAAGTT